MDEAAIARLTDFDFEQVSKDILEAKFGVSLEIFSRGADKGVDLRHLHGPESLIVQCKHWMSSGRAALRRHLKNAELPKVERLNPTRYVLVTSVSMTTHAKDDWTALLAPFVKSPEDILGLDDICAELRARPDIVRRHLRLWLNSAAMLDALLNKGLLARSRTLLDELDASLKVYAPSESFDVAKKILDDNRVCIIAGVPGIGKTTLAQVLASTYVADGFELIEVSDDVQELFDAWDDEKRQFFYYDDFLGACDAAG